METATRMRPSTAAPSDGSRTLTMTGNPAREEGSGSMDESTGPARPIGVLRLRAKRSGNRVAWGEDVVDNEGAGKKKSKICCIYHRPKRYDESSSDSSDSSDDEHGHSSHSHSHPHSHGHSHEHGQASSSSGQRQQMQSEVHTLDLPENDEPNAYEQGPVRGKGKGKRAGT